MKTLKILLDTDEDEEINVGLVRTAKQLPDYELFFHLNQINSFSFERISDITLCGTYYDYSFTRFQGYHHASKNCYQFISNKNNASVQKKVSNELFADEEAHKYLLESFQDVDYIIKTSDQFDDFSLILLPENLMFQIQSFTIDQDSELFQIIQYYE